MTVSLVQTVVAIQDSLASLRLITFSKKFSMLYYAATFNENEGAALPAIGFLNRTSEIAAEDSGSHLPSPIFKGDPL